MKALSPKERKTKEQFDRHPHMPNKGSSWERESYPNYKTSKVPFPPKETHVEFGKAFDISPNSYPTAISIAYTIAVEDFFKAKAESFPTWDGLPEIKVNKSSDYGKAIQGGKQISWYVQVPKKYVLSEEDKIKKLDEELWDL